MNRKLLAAAALAAVLPALQGCVTVAAVGAGTVAVMANDRRTTGTYVEDESIEWQVIAKLAERLPERPRQRDELQPQGPPHRRSPR